MSDERQRHAGAACAVIVAGGSGERFGAAGGKQLASLRGLTVLGHSIKAFDGAQTIDHIIVVCHPDRLEEYVSRAIDPVGTAKPATVVTGGDTRQDSVEAGLRALPPGCAIVAVHDGARSLVLPATIDAAVRQLRADPAIDGVVVGHPSYDTLKEVRDGRIVATPDRDLLWIAQTPQVFRTDVLLKAYKIAGREAASITDDAGLVERIGAKVRMLPGPRDNIKVTVAEDLTTAEAILAAREGG